MRTKNIVFLLLVISHTIYGQSNFIRPSISVLELKNNEENSKLKLNYIHIPRQFDENKLSEKVITSSRVSSAYNLNQNLIIEIFKEENVGTKSFSSVLPIRNGKFSNEVIKERGMYSATDSQVNDLKGRLNENFANQSDNFGDIGLKQLNRIYVLMLYVYEYQETDNSHLVGCSGKVKYFLIKTDNAILAYNTYKDNIEKLKDAQWGGHVVYSNQIFEDISVSIDDESEPITIEELKNNFSEKIGNRVFFDILRQIEEVQPKSTIIITPKKKISAKIGKKENLKIDNRFYVYEKTLNQINGKDSIYLKKISQLRVRKVGNNTGVATGKSDASIFYKIAGRRVSEGMLLIQKEDIGIGISIGYGTMQWLRFDYRLKGIAPGLKVFLALNDLSNSSGKIRFNPEAIGKKINVFDSKKIAPLVNYTTLSFEAGFEWAYILNSRLQFIPFIAIGYSSTAIQNSEFYNSSYQLSWHNNKKFFEGYNFNPGARLSFNLFGSISIVGSAGYSIFSINTYEDLKYKDNFGIERYLFGGNKSSGSSDIWSFYNNELIQNNPSKLKGLRWDISIRYEF